MKSKFKRVFIVVMDSAGIGAMPDAAKFGDEGSSTIVHLAEKNNGLHVPNMEKFGLGELNNILVLRKFTITNNPTPSVCTKPVMVKTR